MANTVIYKIDFDQVIDSFIGSVELTDEEIEQMRELAEEFISDHLPDEIAWDGDEFLCDTESAAEMQAFMEENWKDIETQTFEYVCRKMA